MNGDVFMLGDDEETLFGGESPAVLRQKALAAQVRQNPALIPTSGMDAPKPEMPPRAAPAPAPAPAAAPVAGPAPVAQGGAAPVAGAPDEASESYKTLLELTKRMGQRPDPAIYKQHAQERGEAANRKLMLGMTLAAMGGEGLAPLGGTLAQQGMKEGGDYEIPGGWGVVTPDGKVIWNEAKVSEQEADRLTKMYGLQLGEEGRRRADRQHAEAAKDRLADRAVAREAVAAQRATTEGRAREALEHKQTQDRIVNENRYRDDFDRITKNTRDVLDTSRALTTLPTDGSRLSPVEQQSLIIMLNKFQDPGSVVREGEFDRVKLAQGILQRWGNVPAQIRSGQVLSPALQRDIQQVIKLYTDAAENTMKAYGANYVRMAEADKLRPEHVVSDRRWHPGKEEAKPGGRGTAESPLQVAPRAAEQSGAPAVRTVDY